MKDQDLDEADRSVIVECDLDEPPEKVWRALTVPEIVESWLLPNDMRAQEGRRFTLKAKDDEGGDIACEVLSVEPNRLIRYSWRGEEELRDGADRSLDTVVTFVLTETPTGGTHLRLVHGGFASGSKRAEPQASSTTFLASTATARRKRPRWRDRRAVGTGFIAITARRMRWAA
jgi:uncharacterized protein YndB with AHSA1/START domain